MHRASAERGKHSAYGDSCDVRNSPPPYSISFPKKTTVLEAKLPGRLGNKTAREETKNAGVILLSRFQRVIFRERLLTKRGLGQSENTRGESLGSVRQPRFDGKAPAYAGTSHFYLLIRVRNPQATFACRDFNFRVFTGAGEQALPAS